MRIIGCHALFDFLNNQAGYTIASGEDETKRTVRAAGLQVLSSMEDVQLMVETDGRGRVNPKGLQYYNNFINELISNEMPRPRSDLINNEAFKRWGMVSEHICKIAIVQAALPQGIIISIGKKQDVSMPILVAAEAKKQQFGRAKQQK
ncbi:glycosyl hydrolase 1 [Trifolium repens]|nr:glycosyl hydrolase 1 [Trifolium repens]